MAAPKGHPRYGGRSKGTPNRFSQNLIEICKEKDLDVFEALVEIAKNDSHPDNFHSLKELAQYLYPKRKSLEHSGEVNTNPYMLMPFKELEELVKAKLLEGK